MSNECLPFSALGFENKSDVKRPVLNYFGGKWRIAKWCISYFPRHTRYTEVFGGAASCLLRKPRCPVEVYNDLNDEVVNLFRVLRDPDAASDLIELVYRTPYARTEYLDSYVPCSPAVEQARRTLLRYHAAFGSDCQTDRKLATFKTGKDGKDAPAWATLPEHLKAIVDRLKGVLIENRDALEVLRKYDHPDTLHFVDPPYVTDTRSSKRMYRYELDDARHKQLAETLQSVSGMVVLAGYPSALYDELYPGWRQVTTQNKTCGNSYRTEALWLSPQTVEKLDTPSEFRRNSGTEE